MNPAAARAQALLTGETDAQLTQGLTEGSIRYLPNATTAPAFPARPNSRSQSASVRVSESPGDLQHPSNTQYTPSAQDAAAGAYSAQKPSFPACHART